MNFDRLNAVAKGEHRTVKKISELVLNQLYSIQNIRKATTRYGEKVIVDIEDDVYCYLPARVGKELLADGEEGLREFLSQLEVSEVCIRRIEGRFNPIEFLIKLPEDPQEV